MNIIYDITVALSAGIIFGFSLGIIKTLRKKKYSEQKIEFTKKLIEKLSYVLKYVTCFLLAIGFIWCVYFLLMGILVPKQAEYADNMSELIVSVLTVISIIFAFVEFTRRKDK